MEQSPFNIFFWGIILWFVVSVIFHYDLLKLRHKKMNHLAVNEEHWFHFTARLEESSEGLDELTQKFLALQIGDLNALAPKGRKKRVQILMRLMRGRSLVEEERMTQQQCQTEGDPHSLLSPPLLDWRAQNVLSDCWRFQIDRLLNEIIIYCLNIRLCYSARLFEWKMKNLPPEKNLNDIPLLFVQQIQEKRVI